MTFQLDTSGYVLRGDPTMVGRTIRTYWSDLSPFTQGYIEALFSSAFDNLSAAYVARHGVYEAGDLAFSDLAPETLARIIADCEAANRIWIGEVSSPSSGKHLWDCRQRGEVPAFPPLTVQLGDDGKVRFA